MSEKMLFQLWSLKDVGLCITSSNMKVNEKYREIYRLDPMFMNLCLENVFMVKWQNAMYLDEVWYEEEIENGWVKWKYLGVYAEAFKGEVNE